MKFVQIMEIKTTKYDELDAILNDWLAKTEGRRTAHRAVMTRDRERPDTYVNVIEFPSYEEAMKNSNLPETQEIAAKMGALCDSVTFVNLDVLREENL